MVKKEFINPDNLFPPSGFSHVMVTYGGKTIHISGQTAINAEGEIIGGDDLRRQTKQTYENLKIALASADATFEDVVKISIYVVNLKSQDLEAIREIRNQYYCAESPPASTIIGVQALALPGLLIEVEATAVIEKKIVKNSVAFGGQK